MNSTITNYRPLSPRQRSSTRFYNHEGLCGYHDGPHKHHKSPHRDYEYFHGYQDDPHGYWNGLQGHHQGLHRHQGVNEEYRLRGMIGEGGQGNYDRYVNVGREMRNELNNMGRYNGGLPSIKSQYGRK